MKIYFSGSIRGVKGDKHRYKRFIELLSMYGKVLTEHSFDYSYSEELQMDDRSIYDCDMSWIREANLLVAEVSSPSLGVGYEIAKAEDLNKPIVCLYREQVGKQLSAMINGNPCLKIIKYSDQEDALNSLDQHLKVISSSV